MTTRKSDWGLLAELRDQLQQCDANGIEVRRSDMLSLVDEMLNRLEQRMNGRGETIQILENAFLEGVLPGTTLTREEHNRRADDLEKAISGLDVIPLLHLFFRLEYEAANKIYSLYALVKTIDPERIKEQCSWLPDSLIRDADRALKADKIKGGSHKVLSPFKQEAFRRECLDWIRDQETQKTELCKNFNNRMAEKYHIAVRTAESFRLAIQKELHNS
ncbi:hypothetical protein [Stutzerimonas kunmingensis]|uniref:hypothetical protein n=1 Tax=Stutzerimonas kunmingensis TaxID=1211807 RepID=UPI0028A5C6CC|nr:hypothetical protein [Stutzerimonas kunmingensis]